MTGPVPGATRSKDRSKKDVVSISHTGDENRWVVTVTLGTVTHDLGEFDTVSAALTAIMRFYYQHRPAARRRKGPSGE
jgi:hypothetical protein